jgi:cell division protein FtsW (lipid II flippase)
MLYVATKKVYYFIGGLAAGSVAAVIAYQLFSHVRTRVVAWRNPLSVIDDEGYQICQSLFAIGTGGWFGMGLYQGAPSKIPVVEQDFIFSAISEEMGGIFALCLILVCVSCFLMFLNVAMQMKDQFYKLVALGLGTVYGFQVFLTIGGVTKFIPSTGVTLPLVSYGGSSLLSTMILFAIIQGLYILKQNEGEKYGKKGKEME